MEVSLEKIELVKDRTGVSYKEAKEALEKLNGNVVDAIIDIEENMNEVPKSPLSEKGMSIIDSLKALVRKGNVSKIVLRKDGEIILNLPVNVGIITGVFYTLPTAVAVAVAFGTKCDIEIVKDNGTIVDVSDMANEKFENIVEKGSDWADEVKTRGTDAYYMAKDKANIVINKVRRNEDETEDEGSVFDGEVMAQDDNYESSATQEEKILD